MLAPSCKGFFAPLIYASTVGLGGEFGIVKVWKVTQQWYSLSTSSKAPSPKVCVRDYSYSGSLGYLGP